MTLVRTKLLEYSRLFNINFTEIRTLYLWGFPRKGYGLWVIEVLWVMVCISLRTNSVDGKKYGLYGGMGYEGYGL